MRRTKIVCTIGPASEDKNILREMVASGMDIARFNFSHGSHEEHGKRMDAVREAAEELGKPVAIMLDTKGPEIRTGLLEGQTIELVEGEEVLLTIKETKGRKGIIPISYKNLAQDVKQGSIVLIDDGALKLEVVSLEGDDVLCRVINGGTLKERKGVNLPGVSVKLPAVTEKDVADLQFGIEKGVDFIAASFMRKAEDVMKVRRVLEEGGSKAHIIAKIEHPDAIDNIDSIIEVSDGIMVARGDLGVELNPEEVPLIQKMIIEKCNKVGKPVITATQMLESMIGHPRPTRAEASDVANAILDGTDAVMLSGETAAGKYPVEAVRFMCQIAVRTEEALRYKEVVGKKEILPPKTVADAISHASCQTANELNAAAILTPTESGSTARMVAKYRPYAPIVAATPNPDVVRKLALTWGVCPLLVERTYNTDAVVDAAVQGALKEGMINEGDLIVITAGLPIGVSGATNLLKVHVASKILCQGQGVGKKSARGIIRKIRNEEDGKKFNKGDILVTWSLERELMGLAEEAGAIIAEEGGLTSPAAIVGINFGIPVIVGVTDAMELLKDGERVTVDATRGIVYSGEATVL